MEELTLLLWLLIVPLQSFVLQPRVEMIPIEDSVRETDPWSDWRPERLRETPTADEEEGEELTVTHPEERREEEGRSEEGLTLETDSEKWRIEEEKGAAEQEGHEEERGMEEERKLVGGLDYREKRFENGQIEADEEHEEEEKRRDNGEGRHEEGIRSDDEERDGKEQRSYGGEEKLEEDLRVGKVKGPSVDQSEGDYLVVIDLPPPTSTSSSPVEKIMDTQPVNQAINKPMSPPPGDMPVPLYDVTPPPATQHGLPPVTPSTPSQVPESATHALAQPASHIQDHIQAISLADSELIIVQSVTDSSQTNLREWESFVSQAMEDKVGPIVKVSINDNQTERNSIVFLKETENTVKQLKSTTKPKQAKPTAKELQPTAKELQPTAKELQPTAKPKEMTKPTAKELQPTAKELQPTAKPKEMTKPTAKELQPTAKPKEMTKPTAKELQPTAKELKPTAKELQPTAKELQPTAKPKEMTKPTAKELQPTVKPKEMTKPTAKELKPTAKPKEMTKPTAKELQPTVKPKVTVQTNSTPKTQQTNQTPKTQQAKPTAKELQPTAKPKVTVQTNSTPKTQQTNHTPKTQQTKPTPKTQQAKPTAKELQPTAKPKEITKPTVTVQTNPTPKTLDTKHIPKTLHTNSTPKTQQTNHTPKTQQTKPTPETQLTEPTPETQLRKPRSETQLTKPTPKTQQTKPTARPAVPKHTMKLTSTTNNLKTKTGKHQKKDKINERKGKPLKKDNKTKETKQEKKEGTNPAYFPYFKDNYCPPECACYGRVVQCSDKGVEKVPYGIPYNSRYILLMNNRIDSIQLDLLNEYLSMEFLVLSNNRLTDGSIEGAFEGIPALRRLYLDRNLLESVPTDLPASLEELRLDDNHLNVMSEGAWAHCPGLLVLSLSNNSLGNGNDTLPASVLSPLGSLRTLSLDHNRLASVPLGLPLSIRELYLRGNLIQKFPGEAFMGTSELVILDLSANRLTNHGLLRESLVNATHMESLNLEGNQLKKVPRHLPSSLKTLNLEGNLISSVGKASFLHLPHLEHLGLASNKIARVALGAFRALPVLHQLDLCHNALNQVPRQLPRGLHSVALTHNKIHSVPRDAFCWGGSDPGLSSLVLVQLEHNLIDLGHLDAKAFHCLRGFQVVHFY